MSRSGHSDDVDDQLAAGRWRGRVASSIRGKRGQALLRDLLVALDAMPVKELAAESLVTPEGEYCTLGVLGAARGLPIAELDPENYVAVAATFDVSDCLVREIVFMNDEGSYYSSAETPADRWSRMREWISRLIKVPQ